jgi:SpoIID/LytB domain protein
VGPSGIIKLRIEGEFKSLVIGKELEIRRVLSRSHLYSSAFEVERVGSDFVLHGKGWGHGVGLCQIGAAVMAKRGKSYREILGHYYPGTGI